MRNSIRNECREGERRGVEDGGLGRERREGNIKRKRIHEEEKERNNWGRGEYEQTEKTKGK